RTLWDAKLIQRQGFLASVTNALSETFGEIQAKAGKERTNIVMIRLCLVDGERTVSNEATISHQPRYQANLIVSQMQTRQATKLRGKRQAIGATSLCKLCPCLREPVGRQLSSLPRITILQVELMHFSGANIYMLAAQCKHSLVWTYRSLHILKHRDNLH